MACSKALREVGTLPKIRQDGPWKPREMPGACLEFAKGKALPHLPLLRTICLCRTLNGASRRYRFHHSLHKSTRWFSVAFIRYHFRLVLLPMGSESDHSSHVAAPRSFLAWLDEAAGSSQQP